VDQARLEPEDRRRLRERPERVGGQQLNGDVLSQPREPFANPVDEQTAVGEGAVDVKRRCAISSGRSGIANLSGMEAAPL
jgi:hypothetical protein